MAFGAGGQAGVAVHVLTRRAGGRAVAAERFVTGVAAPITVEAQRSAAAGAVVRVVGRDRVAAMAAVAALPVVQLEVGTLSVVGLQDTGHDLEEVPQPALRQRPLDRQPAIPLAQPLAEDMGMDVTVAAAGPRLERNDGVALLVRQRRPAQLDLVPAQVDPFQADRVGRHGQHSGLPVDPDRLVLLVESDQIGIQVPQRRHTLGWCPGFQQQLEPLELVRQRTAGIADAEREFAGGECPPPAAGMLQQSRGPDTLVPGRLRQRDQAGTVGMSGVLGLDCRRRPDQQATAWEWKWG